jgi:hypothetical protein
MLLILEVWADYIKFLSELARSFLGLFIASFDLAFAIIGLWKSSGLKLLIFLLTA